MRTHVHVLTHIKHFTHIHKTYVQNLLSKRSPLDRVVSASLLFSVVYFLPSKNNTANKLWWNPYFAWNAIFYFKACPLFLICCQSFYIFSAAAAKSLQPCPTLCNPIGGSPPGSPVPGILQGRTMRCHFLLQCMKVKSESEVAQSCLTLSDPMDCATP